MIFRNYLRGTEKRYPCGEWALSRPACSKSSRSNRSLSACLTWRYGNDART